MGVNFSELKTERPPQNKEKYKRNTSSFRHYFSEDNFGKIRPTDLFESRRETVVRQQSLTFSKLVGSLLHKFSSGKSNYAPSISFFTLRRLLIGTNLLAARRKRGFSRWKIFFQRENICEAALSMRSQYTREGRACAIYINVINVLIARLDDYCGSPAIVQCRAPRKSVRPGDVIFAGRMYRHARNKEPSSRVRGDCR